MARDFWYCNVCNAQNSVIDGECQFCDCQGPECKRDNCSDPKHFHSEHVGDDRMPDACYYCARDEEVPHAGAA